MCVTATNFYLFIYLRRADEVVDKKKAQVVPSPAPNKEQFLCRLFFFFHVKLKVATTQSFQMKCLLIIKAKDVRGSAICMNWKVSGDEKPVKGRTKINSLIPLDANCYLDLSVIIIIAIFPLIALFSCYTRNCCNSLKWRFTGKVVLLEKQKKIE